MPHFSRFLDENPIRKLEPLTSEVAVSWCDTVLSDGTEQPNNFRQTAAACLGQECHVVLGGKPLDTRQDSILHGFTDPNYLEALIAKASVQLSEAGTEEDRHRLAAYLDVLNGWKEKIGANQEADPPSASDSK